MKTTLGLPLPQLIKGRFTYGELNCPAEIEAYHDPGLFQATGIHAAFTLRGGGASQPPFDSLNLGTHVQDDSNAVAENRRRVLAAFDAQNDPLLVPNQVHGDHVEVVDSCETGNLEGVRAAIADGDDALVVSVPEVAALLCYADCVPLIMAAPDGSFAIVHAGWRGVDNGIAVKALDRLVAQAGLPDASAVNVYRGPYIHRECFETGLEVYERFIAQFGIAVAFDEAHIDLGAALDISLMNAGVDSHRIADVDSCTVCHNRNWFSYRAQGGVCGRHGAFAVRHDAARL